MPDDILEEFRRATDAGESIDFDRLSQLQTIEFARVDREFYEAHQKRQDEADEQLQSITERAPG